MEQSPKKRLPIRTPDQRAVTDQLRDLVIYAHKQGLYDAADWIQQRLAPEFRVSSAETLLAAAETLKSETTES